MIDKVSCKMAGCPLSVLAAQRPARTAYRPATYSKALESSTFYSTL